MICPSCKDGRLLYLTHETKVTKDYDHRMLYTFVYLECEKCKTVRKQESANMVGTMPVGDHTAARLRDSASKSTARTAESASGS